MLDLLLKMAPKLYSNLSKNINPVVFQSRIQTDGTRLLKTHDEQQNSIRHALLIILHFMYSTPKNTLQTLHLFFFLVNKTQQ